MFKFLFSSVLFFAISSFSYSLEYSTGGMIGIHSFEVDTGEKYFVECSGTGFTPLTINPAWLAYNWPDGAPTAEINPEIMNIGEWSFKLEGYWKDNTDPSLVNHLWYRFEVDEDDASTFNFNGNVTPYNRLVGDIIEVVQWGDNYSSEEYGIPNNIPITSFTLEEFFQLSQPTTLFHMAVDEPDSNIPPKYIDHAYDRFVLLILGGIVEPDYVSDVSCSTYKAEPNNGSIDPDTSEPDTTEEGDNAQGNTTTDNSSAGALDLWVLLLLMLGGCPRTRIETKISEIV